MLVYARAGVSFAWLVDPLACTIEAYRLEGSLWVRVGAWADDDVAPSPPFEAVPLELRWLWPGSPNSPPEGG
jgi:hypothetical protein